MGIFIGRCAESLLTTIVNNLNPDEFPDIAVINFGQMIKSRAIIMKNVSHK